jgi:hypothetical protein
MTTMNDQTMLDDVRAAKKWVDTKAVTMQELGNRLRATEQAYRNRTGTFATLPMEPSESVTREISEAADEPGAALIKESRALRHPG